VSRKLLIVDGSHDPAELTRERLARFTDLAALCWLAPETVERLQRTGGVRCHPLPEVVGGLRRWERGAIELAARVSEGGPRHRGRPWRRMIAEPLYREALEVRTVLDAEHLRRRLGADAERRVSPAKERLFRALDPADPSADGDDNPPSPSLAARLLRRLRRVRLTGGLGAQLWNLLDQLDATYSRRLAVERWRRRPRVEPGGVTCFSSYLNNTRTLRHLEPHLPAAPTWVVTNLHARPADPRGGGDGDRGGVHWLWRFAPRVPAPAAEEDLRDPIDDEGGDELERRALRAWLAASPTWAYWRHHGRCSLPALTACWERYLERARPGLVAVASQWGIEGWLADAARDRGIPVLQLLHGVLGGDFYTGGPLRSDALLVWGDFWRRLWPEEERGRIHPFTPPSAFPEVARRPAERPRLTYFSWPFDRLPFYAGAELTDGLVDLFHPLVTAGACHLTVRAHPLENPDDLVARWRRRHGSVPAGVAIHQRQPLAETLAVTDVAVMFRSTVMLDAFANRIPILLPGWIDFDWRERLRGVPGVHLAAGFDDLGEVLRAWLADPPELDLDRGSDFLRPPAESPEEELRRLLGELLR